MSDEQESNLNSQEEEQEDDQNEDQQDEDEQDDDEQDDDDDQEGSGNQDDEDQDESGSDGDEDEDDQQPEEQDQDQEQNNKKLPSFNIPQREPPTQFKFTSLLSQIANLSCSVDNFIGSLHTSSSSGFARRPYSNYALQQTSYQPRISEIKVPDPPAQSKVVIMKDEDTQVDMKPQIIIQPTKPIQQEPVIQAKPYKISTQSQKFLAQLYQQNKRLKRWQTNPSHPMASYMTSYSGSNGLGVSGNGFYGSREKFERKQYEKGLFNVDQRNKQIDEAIMMLKREEEDDY